ncbi:MAG TPA: FtsX-like permease family protein [Isosphaeraceae bacterium]|jgi:putative ABC transport system permease protein|nr:FtsX-like permease family protein [Isosphaeraceae bacterium]
MKFLGYIFRNARRNPIRSLLTIASIAVCLFLMMILISFLSINTESLESIKVHNRIVTMSSQGFSQPVPIARVRDVAAMPGIVAATPFMWYGGKYNEEVMPFAQFGVNPDTVFTIYEEFKVQPDQIKAFQDDLTGCVIGRKLAEDRGLKVGDRMPLKDGVFPVNLDLTIRGVYDAPFNSDRRMCLFRWDVIDETLKRDFAGREAGNAGMIVAKCKTAEIMPSLCKKIDQEYANSSTPTRTQTEEAFGKMFADMFGDMRSFIRSVGLAVVFSLVCVSGNAMAMSMRERTTEVAVLKAMGFSKLLVVYLVLTEAVLVAGVGGLLGAFGSKAFFDTVDIARYSAGFLPFFYVPWTTALWGLAFSFLIGLASGVVPAMRAAQLSVINGLRKVV